MLAEIDRQRDLLMSDYVHLLWRVVAVPYREPQGIDSSIRLADFAGLAGWIGSALGAEHEIVGALNKLQPSQHIFATEEADISVLLDEWLEQTPEGQMTGVGSNEGRRVLTKELHAELRPIAEHFGMRWRFESPQTLGTHLKTMEEALSVRFDVGAGHGKKGNWWSFSSRNHAEDES